MPVLINITSENLLSEKELKEIEKKTEKALKYLKFHKKEVSLVLTDNRTIKKLNKQYLERHYPTNVLAFPFSKEKPRVSNILGEVIVSVEKARQEAKLYQLNFKNYLFAIIIHGLIHLLDYDHEKGLFSPFLMVKNELNLFSKLAFKKGTCF